MSKDSKKKSKKPKQHDEALDALSKSQRKAYKSGAVPGESVAEWLVRLEGDPAVIDADPTDDVAARVAAKRVLRAAGIELEAARTNPDAIDRDNAELVAAYNLIVGVTTGHYLTSNVERERTAERLATPDELVVEINNDTGRGREFVAGPAEPSEPKAKPANEPPLEDFAKPSEAAPELEEGRNGYRIIMIGADGKPDPKTVRQFTRVTTYIDNLEDKSTLERWKMRTLLEGVAIVETDPEREGVIPGLADLIHVRDVALAKARKADRKGKLEPGELGDLEYAANKTFKDAADELARVLLDVGGVHVKANKGTDLHALCEIYDNEGMVAINALLRAEKITKSDHADVVAYAEAMLAAGVKVLEAETVVVHDGLKRAGRLDRIVLAKVPGGSRAVRMVADIKTGRVDYGVGKIAQQCEAYASSSGYDLVTGERRDLKLSKSAALLIHLPAGKAKCSIYVVDLKLGAKANKLSAEVRAWRNEGKRAIDFSIDLAAPAAMIADLETKG